MTIDAMTPTTITSITNGRGTARLATAATLADAELSEDAADISGDTCQLGAFGPLMKACRASSNAFSGAVDGRFAALPRARKGGSASR